MNTSALASFASGAATLLCWQVEGALPSELEDTPTAMTQMLALVDDAITLHGGVESVVDDQAMGSWTMFAQPAAAVAAAFEIQCAFARPSVGGCGSLSVRLALHTGAVHTGATRLPGGPTLIRGAGLLSVAHAGQTLLSDATRQALGDASPAGAALRDLGVHRLKDLGLPERVWQLHPIEAVADFPPLRSLGALPTNLPVRLSSFVGRVEELQQLLQAIRQHRLVTVTGAGGCGKTRLAMQVAAESLREAPDGVWCVELAAVADGAEIAPEIARVFGLREEFGRSLVDTLAREFHALDMLLILDNCEHVLAASARMVSQLMRAAPKLRIVATSREPFGVDGELTWRVPSLDGPTGAALFVERARQVRPAFAPTVEEAVTIGQIVDRLDGIPLAIELAAARVRMLQPARILAALDDRFRLLTGGSRELLARQQTLEASVAWSYEHLEPAEQLLARRLAILHSFGLETAEAVGSDASIDAYAVLDLTRLVDKSMVQVEHANGEARYRFLETVRQYLQARAGTAGEMAALRQRHLLHFLDLAESLEPRLALGDGPTCLARLQLEFRNLDDALAWAEASGASAEMLRLVTALSLFYELRGHLAHGGRWFDRALAAAPAHPSALRARALWGAAHVGFYGGNYAAAATRGADALAMGEAIADKWATARALNTLGVLQALSTPTLARDMLTRSIELGAAIDDQWAVADGWKMVTVAWYVQHADHDARPALAALYRIGDALGSRFFLAWHQSMVGYFARDRGDYDAARTAFTLSLEYCHYVGDPSTGGFSEAWSAALDADLGDVDKAKQRLQHLLATAAVSGSELAVPEALFALARILIAEGDSAQARRLLAPQVEAFRDARVASGAGQLYIALGAACRVCGDLPSALAALDEASALASSLANPLMDSLILFERAQLADMAGDNGQAEDLLHAALSIQASSGLRPSAIATLESLAAIAARADSSVEAGV